MPRRRCSVEIRNNTNSYTLSNPRVYTVSGFCQVSFPPMVGPCSAVKARFNKTTGLASGAVGVFTFDLFNAELNDYNHIMAVMFSVPYDRILFSNWLAVGIFNKGRKCDHSLYYKMYNGGESDFVRGKADEPGLFYEGDYVILSASMTDSGEAVLTVEISDTGLY
ncbi:DELTA-sagatoxin-Srs1a-like [Xiphophorus maculatus]|uniref:DELTA-sagatoxin-Srs1a-like n=1 Tax=Xiphophorus maculatus TaxID=8083 RepID=A0A3B5QEQ4_XIPMA|nr:DELTA-sagatoxin-Srs1a-like [Xiphophorus maculatus]XP_023195913.1 DELTA-sagatoxin-Srs1a-like [Xiphophorus maculatus]